MILKNIGLNTAIILLSLLNTAIRIDSTPLRRLLPTLTSKPSAPNSRIAVKTKLIIMKRKTALESFEELLEYEQGVSHGKPLHANESDELEYIKAINSANLIREKFSQAKMTEHDEDSEVYKTLLHDYCQALCKAEDHVFLREYKNKSKGSDHGSFISHAGVLKSEIEIRTMLDTRHNRPSN